jgi:hypothetical protein
MPHNVFISHAEEDSAIAVELAQALEQAGFVTWYYERDGRASERFTREVPAAINQATTFLVIVSLHSLNSGEVTAEIDRAHRAKKKFLPLLLGITLAEFQQRQNEWRQAMGGAWRILPNCRWCKAF